MMSDDSENDGAYVESGHENNVYYKKYKLLLDECEIVQKNNERLVHRIEEVKKITKRRLDQVQYIKQRLLSKYGEDWTEIPHKVISLDEEVPIKRKVKEEKEKVKVIVNETADKKGRAKPKRPKRRTRTERDPNAPKRPSNPFFQFCQEQRQPMMEQLTAEQKPGETEPINKQELTRQLALKWKTLTSVDKQIYVDMYERSKEKYAAEMSEYNSKK